MSLNEMLLAKPLWAAVLMGLFLPVIGRHLVLGRSILLGLAVPQISMTGIAFLFLGHALGWSWAARIEDESTRAGIGALLFAVPMLLLLASPLCRGRQLSEAWLAFLYLGSVAGGNLMLSSNAVGETYLSDLFHGRLLLISDASLWLLGAVMTTAFVLSWVLRRRFLLVLTDPDFATVARVPVGHWSLALALINGLAIGVAVSATGPLVTFGFLILPVLAAAAWSHSLREHLWFAAFAGTIMAAVGFWCAYRWDLPLGDCVVAFGCVALLLSRGARALVSM